MREWKAGGKKRQGYFYPSLEQISSSHTFSELQHPLGDLSSTLVSPDPVSLTQGWSPISGLWLISWGAPTCWTSLLSAVVNILHSILPAYTLSHSMNELYIYSFCFPVEFCVLRLVRHFKVSY